MANPLHPHWHNTDRSKANQVPVGAVHVSRRPAAIVGMILVIGAGFSFFQGVDQLTGQLTNDNEVIVRIHDNGFTPPTITVQPGNTITWINEQNTPHIIESDTLCSTTGFCLRTKTLFNGDSDSFTITQDITTGNYAYASTTIPTLQGTITVATDAGPGDNFDNLDDLLEDALTDNSMFDPPVNTTTNPPDPIPPTTDTSMFEQPNDGIPRNPYTVDSDRIHPFDGGGQPIPEAFGDDPLPTPPQQATNPAMLNQQLETGTGPAHQPQTGATTTVGVTLLSLAAFFWCIRRLRTS